jgi:hypothetical protein
MVPRALDRLDAAYKGKSTCYCRCCCVHVCMCARTWWNRSDGVCVCASHAGKTINMTACGFGDKFFEAFSERIGEMGVGAVGWVHMSPPKLLPRLLRRR